MTTLTVPAQPVDSLQRGFRTLRSGISGVMLPSVIRAEMDRDAGIPYPRWRAAVLNRLFRQHGARNEPARITAPTVLDGLEKFLRRTQ